MALDEGLKPILCVGELNNKPGSGIDEQMIQQLRSAIHNLTKTQAKKTIFAYEPLWAIGTGKAASGRYVATVIAKLRAELEKNFDLETANDAIFLYGGSVTSENINDYLKYDSIDGALVGGASLIGKDFIKICKEAAEV